MAIGEHRPSDIIDDELLTNGSNQSDNKFRIKSNFSLNNLTLPITINHKDQSINIAIDTNFDINATTTIFIYSGFDNETNITSIQDHDINGTVLPNIGLLGNANVHWTEYVSAFLLCVLIVVTVIGNTLVIISVMTTRRLRTVTNCFVMSLAVADWLVGIFVMPPAVAVDLIGSWPLGWILCDIWISLDVLLCTASILSLCAISIDRYLAVTQPLNYSRRRRSKRLALIMILVVWVLALLITCPPILGWYEPGRRALTECRYNRNKGYVVFSAMGSFFIPMAVMIYVYVRISCVVAKRHEHMTEIEVHKTHNKHFDVENEADYDMDQSSEHEIGGPSPYKKRCGTNLSTTTTATTSTSVTINPQHFNDDQPDHQIAIAAMSNAYRGEKKNGHYELVDTSSSSTSSRPVSLKRNKPNRINHSIGLSSSVHQSNEPSWNKCPHQFSVKHGNNMIMSGSGMYSGEQIHSKHIRAHHKSLSNRILSLKRENKTTQTLSIVVGGFIVCWLPFFVCYLLTPFLPNEHVNPLLAKFLVWLGWFNSAMNPFIYAFYSVDFRAAFWRLTFRRFFKNSTKTPYSSNAMSIKRVQN